MITKWKTKNGTEIDIKNMTTNHIKNCIKAIKEERIVIGENVDIGYTCDGDGDGITYVWLDNGDIYIKAFEEELKRRNEWGKKKN